MPHQTHPTRDPNLDRVRGRTERKPADWDRCPTVVLTATEAAAFAKLDQQDLSENDSPMDDLFPEGGPMEYRVETADGQTYYVNTEGATYARYACRIHGTETAPESTRAPEKPSPTTQMLRAAVEQARETALRILEQTKSIDETADNNRIAGTLMGFQKDIDGTKTATEAALFLHARR